MVRHPRGHLRGATASYGSDRHGARPSGFLNHSGFETTHFPGDQQSYCRDIERVAGPMPLTRWSGFLQNVARSLPTGDMTPIPVMTTARFAHKKERLPERDSHPVANGINGIVRNRKGSSVVRAPVQKELRRHLEIGRVALPCATMDNAALAHYPLALHMLSLLGRALLSILCYLGALALLFWETCQAIVVAPIRSRLFLRQVVEIGYRSQLVVLVTGGFTGAVFAAKRIFQFHRLGMESAVGAVVSVSMFRELGPVLTGLMVADELAPRSPPKSGQ